MTKRVWNKLNSLAGATNARLFNGGNQGADRWAVSAGHAQGRRPAGV